MSLELDPSRYASPLRGIPASDLNQCLLAQYLHVGVDDVFTIADRPARSAVDACAGTELLLGPPNDLPNVASPAQLEGHFTPSDGFRMDAVHVGLLPQNDAIGAGRNNRVPRAARAGRLGYLHDPRIDLSAARVMRNDA
jgi:hypothetical protein